MKYIIYEKLDGNLIIQGFTKKFNNQFSLEELLEKYRAPNTEGLKHYFLEGCGAHHTGHKDGCCDFKATDHIDKWHIENGKLTTDTNWEKLLIPHPELSRKIRKRALDSIEVEHEKTEPDPVKLSKLKWEHDKAIEWGKVENHKLYEIALRIMDEENIEKPLIRQKLQAKIDSLKSK